MKFKKAMVALAISTLMVFGMSTATFAASSPKVTPKPECKTPTTTTKTTGKKAACKPGKSDKTADASAIPMLAEALLAGGAVAAGAKYKLTK